MADEPNSSATPTPETPPKLAPLASDPPKDAPASGAESTPQSGTGAAAGFTQKDLNKAAGAAREEGKSKALADKAQEHGFASVEEMEAAIKAHKDAESERMSQLEKAQKDNEKAQNRISQLESTLRETLSKAQNVALDSEARLTALALDVKPERVNAVLKLADLGEVSVDEEDFSVDGPAAETAIKAVLEEYPEFVAVGPANIGGPSNPPGEAPNPYLSPAEMTREQRDEMAARAIRGEKIALRG